MIAIGYLALSDHNWHRWLVTTEIRLCVATSKSFLIHVAGLCGSKVNCLNSQVSVANCFVGWCLWRFRVSHRWIRHAGTVGLLKRKGALRPPHLGASLWCKAGDSPRKPALCNVLSEFFGGMKRSQRPSWKFLRVGKSPLAGNTAVRPCPPALALMLLGVNTARALRSTCGSGTVRRKCIAKVSVFVPFPDLSWYWTKGDSVLSQSLVLGAPEKGSRAAMRFHGFKTAFLVPLWPEVSRETTLRVSSNSLSLHKGSAWNFHLSGRL